MGFVDKPDGAFNEHEYNWPDSGTGTGEGRKVGVHIKTKDDAAREDASLTSLQTLETRGFYVSPDKKVNNLKVLRKTNVKKQNIYDQPSSPKKVYGNLKFSESNMIMYLNSLELDLFNPENSFVFNRLTFDDFSDEILTAAYNKIVNNYNKKSFDPDTQSYTDGNGNNFSHDIKTISESKTSPVLPTLEEYVEQNRLTGRKAAFTKMLEKRGIINGQ